MRLLFWNTAGLDDATLLAALAGEHDVDLLILAEPGASLANLLVALNSGRQALYFPDQSPGLSDRLQIFYRYDPASIIPIEDAGEIAIRTVQPPLYASVLLVVAHLPSKLWQKPDDQLVGATIFSELINKAEARVGHHRTIVIGDFNMSPFEAGMVSAGGLHATMDRKIALRSRRVVQGRPFRFFYNPMWSLLGDRGNQPPGSYYYDSGSYENYYWHVFDQVLLRPELLLGFDPDTDVRILTDISGRSLIRGRDGRPDEGISDHLPILLTLELQEVIK